MDRSNKVQKERSWAEHPGDSREPLNGHVTDGQWEVHGMVTFSLLLALILPQAPHLHPGLQLSPLGQFSDYKQLNKEVLGLSDLESSQKENNSKVTSTMKNKREYYFLYPQFPRGLHILPRGTLWEGRGKERHYGFHEKKQRPSKQVKIDYVYISKAGRRSGHSELGTLSGYPEQGMSGTCM
jgi:hypothetical protein